MGRTTSLPEGSGQFQGENRKRLADNVTQLISRTSARPAATSSAWQLHVCVGLPSGWPARVVNERREGIALIMVCFQRQRQRVLFFDFASQPSWDRFIFELTIRVGRTSSDVMSAHWKLGSRITHVRFTPDR